MIHSDFGFMNYVVFLYFRLRNWFVMSVWLFDLILTFKSNMTPSSHPENCVLNSLVPCATRLMVCGGIYVRGNNFAVSLMTTLSLDHQLQYAPHLENGVYKRYLENGVCKRWANNVALAFWWGWGWGLDQAIATCCQFHNSTSFWFSNVKLFQLPIWICWFFQPTFVITTTLITTIEQTFMSQDLVGQWSQHVVYCNLS